MQAKLNCILLIDDDEPTNFLHRMIINRAECTEKVVVYEDARKALDFLQKKEQEAYSQPDLIFLDINMPGMNGWEFLEVYENLTEEQRGRVVIMMLTTSLNPDDRKRADSLAHVAGFLTKPLTKVMLQEVIEKHF